jgi:hypothetical protein
MKRWPAARIPLCDAFRAHRAHPPRAGVGDNGICGLHHERGHGVARAHLGNCRDTLILNAPAALFDR